MVLSIMELVKNKERVQNIIGIKLKLTYSKHTLTNLPIPIGNKHTWDELAY